MDELNEKSARSSSEFCSMAQQHLASLFAALVGYNVSFSLTFESTFGRVLSS